MAASVKICGVKTEVALQAAIKGGADYVGCVLFPKSPRAVEPKDAYRLTQNIASKITKVALIVDADDALIDAAAGFADILQLHGSETPDRVTEVKARIGKPVIKAVSIAEKLDIDRARAYESVVDMLLFDAKPPKSGGLPGGNGISFDWQLLAGAGWKVPWMLSGGLTPENVGEAIELTGAPIVDVSSGVECAPGEKDPDLIRAFLKAAQFES